MSDDVKVTTNNVPRFTIDACELTPAERAEFDWLDWSAIDEGCGSASFFRYRGQLYSLDQFTYLDHPAGPFAGWHGISHDSAFSGVLVKISDDGETVTVATYFA
jgi:hypothetical protein